jgi:hypothetical protein
MAAPVENNIVNARSAGSNDAISEVQLQKAENVFIQQLKGSPNPFTTFVNVSGKFEKAQPKVTVRLTDFRGRIVYSKEFNNVAAGNWNQRLELGYATSQPGVYFLQVIGTGPKNSATFKLLKVSH